MTIDTNPFANAVGYQTYANAKAQFDSQQAAAAQALQTAAADAALKQNALKAQLVGAAAGAGTPEAIASAKQQLAAQGINASDVPDDVAGATNYANAAINAQKPYALGNAITKAVGANGAAVAAFGSVPAAMATGNYVPVPTGAIGSQPAATQPQSGQSFYTPTAAAPNASPAATAAAGVVPVQQPGNDAASVMDPGNQGTPSPLSFAPFRPQGAGEGIASYQSALKNYNDMQMASPTYLKAKAAAEGAGKDQNSANTDAVKAGTGYDQVVQTIEALKQLAPSVPQQTYLIPSSVKAAISQNIPAYDGQQSANAMNTFNTVNESQTINAIRDLANTGQIRMTRTLENIINKGYLVDPNASPTEKVNQANAIETELRNSTIGAQNVNAQLNGGATQPMTSPLTAPPGTAAPAPSLPPGTTQYGTSGGKPVYRVPDGKGGFQLMMEQ